MSDPLFHSADGQTPLGEDEMDGLRLTWVRTRGDLNQAETENIIAARSRLRPPGRDTVLDDLWLRALHRRMFGDVWAWAGQYRTTERNIGIDPVSIATATRDLVENAVYWAAATDAESTRRGAVARFHHQLVAIHPFPNGNGRHARAAADYLAHALDLPAPSWGRHDARELTRVRASYLAALRAADRDNDDLDQLIDFTWS